MIHRRQLATEAFNQELYDAILLRAQCEPSYPSHNRGGWRSDEELLTWPVPAIEHLRDLVRSAFDEITNTRRKKWRAWAIVNRDGSYHGRHKHSGEWTGIYYVTSGSSETVFEFPDRIERVTPEAGLLVISPSSVTHFVETCSDSAPRVTIAFEAR
ncbi:MAG: hypothetical protein ACREJC_07355 [Tepidisphaeraceae bacterium]